MISYYQHPYLLASLLDNFAIDFYKKYIVTPTQKNTNYDFDNLKNGFFLGCRPNCIHVFIDEDRQEAIINNFTYFTNCSVEKSKIFPTQEIKPSFSRREKLGFICSIYKKNPIKMAIKIIKKKYKNVKVIKLTDKTTINKFPLYIYMILYYGETYYMKYGFLPEHKSKMLELINSNIFEKTIKLDNIIDFFGETNKDCIELCEKIIRKNNKLKYFLEKIKFIKDEIFFALLEYIYKIFFPGFNFFEESYYLTKIF
jgi:hypothetical protein